MSLILVLAAAGAACTVLPTTTTTSQTQWRDYQTAHDDFDAVVVGSTTHKQLKRLGFSTEAQSNIKVLNYVDVGNLFGSSFRPDDLPKGVKTCVTAQEQCFAYVVAVRNVANKRDGNIPLDLFGFRKHTRTSGWEFQATLVLVNDTVVYKLWNGTPKVELSEQQNTPLGPLQNLSGLLPKPGL